MVYDDLRAELMTQYLQKDNEFFLRYNTGDLITRINGDLKVVKTLCTSSTTNFLKSSMISMQNLYYMFIVSWKLTFGVFFIVPLYIFLSYIFQKISKDL